MRGDVSNILQFFEDNSKGGYYLFQAYCVLGVLLSCYLHAYLVHITLSTPRIKK